MRGSVKCKMNVKETHNKPLKGPGACCTAIYEDGWINVHPRRECAQNGSGRAYMAMCDFDRDTRSAYEIMDSDTGYGSKSRKAVRITPRRNSKSWISTVKFLEEAVGTEMMTEMIKETDIGRDDARDIADKDIEDGRYNDIRTYE